MFRWEVRDGYDWQLVEPDEDGAPAMLGATVGYGLIDESAAEYGTLQQFAAALGVELARPVELGTGGVGVPQAIVDVESDTLTVAVRGDRDIVAGAWRRLPDLFAGTIGIEPANPLPVDTWGWANDAFVRTGVNAFALSLVSIDAPRVEAESVARLCDQLNPATGAVRWVMFTTDETLRRAHTFAPPPVTPARSLPRAQGDRVAGMIDATYGGLLYFTAVVPRTEAGIAAGLALRDHFGAALHAATGEGWNVRCSFRGLGADLWISFESAQLPSVKVLRRAITTTVTAPVPDPVVDLAVEAVAASPAAARSRERRAHGLPDGMAVRREDVRAAIAHALRTLHITDTDLGEIAGHPSLDRQLPAEKGQGFPPRLTESELAALDLPRLLSLGERTLRAVVPTDEGVRDAVVDLDHVAAVLDIAPGNFGLLDDRCTIVEVRPDVYANGQELRRRLDERLAGVAHIAITDGTPDHVTEVLARSKRNKLRRYLMAAATLLVVGIGFITVIVRNSGGPDIEPVTARISLGETAKLAGGTALTVQTVDRASTAEHVTTFTVTVRVCAGDDIDADGVDAAVQRKIGPSNFQFWTGDGTAGMRVDDDRPQLRTTTLPRGKCTTGDLIYEMRGAPTDLRIAYDNPYGDDVVWYVR